MSKQTIKNPFGDNIDVPETEEEQADNLDSNNSHNTIKNGGGFQDDYVKNELSKNGINEDSLKIGYKIGEQIVKNSKFVDYFSLDGLKPYFDIDNKYVLIKLRYLFFPFLKGKTAETDELQNKYNIEYFDLYLPIMSFITYALTVGFITALKNPAIFNPHTLGKILSKDFSLYIINAALVKLLMFIFLSHPLSFTEIFSLTGYKFIYMIIFAIFRVCTETMYLKYIVFLLFSLLSVFFTRKCLDKKISNEGFKNTIIYATMAADVCTMFLILL
jgi:hypothetical protein